MSVERLRGRRVVLSVSGGKDSAAASLYLRELGIEHDRVFADTGWEHPLTYEYLRGPLTAKLGPIHEVRSAESFEQLVRKKGIFPDRTKRFCTTLLKVQPIEAFIASFDEEIVNAVGIRRDESRARSNAAEWEWSKSLDCEVWRPIASWSIDDVKAIHKRHGLAPNPLYAMGASRVGCWPCIHARKSEILLVAETDPERIALIRTIEQEVTADARARAAAKGEDLDWARSLFSIKSSVPTTELEDGVEVTRRRHLPMSIDEAVSWARKPSPKELADGRRALQVELFADPNDSCGEWGFCGS